MADEEVEEGEAPPKKSSIVPILIGVILALVLGGGGFFAVYTGTILAQEPEKEMAEEETKEEELEKLPLEAVAFIPIQPLVINIASSSGTRYLKFDAQLEVEPESEQEVTELLPRVVDVLNGYLRAISIEELENPTTLTRLRSQMLRRVQIVTGEGRVRDLLVMEFVVN